MLSNLWEFPYTFIRFTLCDENIIMKMLEWNIMFISLEYLTIKKGFIC